MIASEKELGISEEHEGVIFLDDDAPVGMPLADYMGDAVFEVAILPNMARDASILGIARELAAAFGLELKDPQGVPLKEDGAIEDFVDLEIREPELNPRFMLGMVKKMSAPNPVRIGCAGDWRWLACVRSTRWWTPQTTRCWKPGNPCMLLTMMFYESAPMASRRSSRVGRKRVKS